MIPEVHTHNIHSPFSSGVLCLRQLPPVAESMLMRVERFYQMCCKTKTMMAKTSSAGFEGYADNISGQKIKTQKYSYRVQG